MKRLAGILLFAFAITLPVCGDVELPIPLPIPVAS
jgi:hypothetical protein